MLQKGLIFADHYLLKRPCGLRRFSEVWQAHDQLADRDVAIKVFVSIDNSTLSNFLETIRPLYQLHHPNLLEINALDIYGDYPYLVMPCLMNGSLSCKENIISEKECWEVLHDVAAGLAYLHSKQHPVIHQDIHPENILISDERRYMITDYYISSLFGIASDASMIPRYTNNVRYMAPEQFNSKYTPIMASDIWSLGAMVYELMTGNLPFGLQGGFDQMNGEKLSEIEENYSDSLKQLVYRCLELQPWNRPTANEIVQLKAPLEPLKCPCCGYPTFESFCPMCRCPITRKLPINCPLPSRPVLCSVSKPQSYSDYYHPAPECCPSSSNDESASLNSTLDPTPTTNPLQTVGKVLAAPFVLAANGFSATIKGIGKLAQTKKQVSYHPAKMKGKGDSVFSSVFAPAEVKRNTRMLIQVYLHLSDETEKVKALAEESQKNAKRRDYMPLQCKLHDNDIVDIQMNVYGETLLKSETKHLVWHGSFTKCSFDYFVPSDIDMDELSCVTMLTVNDIPVGELRFVTKIVDTPSQLNPEIIAHRYNKVFISYSHLDEPKVKFLHEGLELGSVPHFFDRRYLKAGDVFPQVIQDYINSADLFILCWSENASKSEYVQKERLQALERAFPQVRPEQAAKLRIYPMSIEPRAELPNDMRDNYHFGEI